MNKGIGSRFLFDETALDTAKICVVGIGGGGGNAVNNMIREGIQDVSFIAINTDAQALHGNLATHKIQAGRALTKGLGTGARPSVGTEAVSADKDAIEIALQGFDLAFITAGMGGGTGTGGAPVVAEIVQKLGILAVAIVTKPFDCEGMRRMEMAKEGIEQLRDYVDTLIVIPNERLLDIADETTSLIEAFRRADDLLYNATRGISDLITIHGLINLDFADVRTTMQDGGTALMGVATAKGEKRAEKAAIEAISSPLLDGMSISGARNVLVNITAGTSLGIREATAATSIIQQEAGPEVEVIFGTVIDEEMKEDLRVTVIATGFNREQSSKATRRTVLLSDPIYDYKGEHSLKILDVPAYERRGTVAATVESGSEEDKKGGRGQIKRLRVDEHASRNNPTDSLDQPAFLRKMMD